MSNIYILDMQTGAMMTFINLWIARDFIEIRSVATIQDAIKDGGTIKKRYKATQGKKFALKERNAYIKEYWANMDENIEKWFDTPFGFKVSNMGRFMNEGTFLAPTLTPSKSYLRIRCNNKTYNVEKMMKEYVCE